MTEPSLSSARLVELQAQAVRTRNRLLVSVTTRALRGVPSAQRTAARIAARADQEKS
jgi:hypothetical protein